jgi:hypothetical protein
MFDFASMGCIIARIAARRATCKLWKPMSADPARTELKLHDDPRLMAAVGAVVCHSAQRAGLPAEAQDGLAAAVIEACRDTFPLVQSDGRDDASLKVAVEDFHDRVEVTIEHSGEALPTAGLDTFCGGAGLGATTGISGSLQDTRVDRVQYETREGRSRMKLTKYCDGRKAKA